MKVNVDFIKTLIEEKNPISLVAERVLNIWLETVQNKIGNYYYEGEEKVKDFEEFFLNTFNEFYYILAK